MSVTKAERAGLVWLTATRSGGGNCIQVTSLRDGGVGVRDSKQPDGPILAYTATEWAAFLDGAKNGEFDHLV